MTTAQNEALASFRLLARHPRTAGVGARARVEEIKILTAELIAQAEQIAAHAEASGTWAYGELGSWAETLRGMVERDR